MGKDTPDSSARIDQSCEDFKNLVAACKEIEGERPTAEEHLKNMKERAAAKTAGEAKAAEAATTAPAKEAAAELSTHPGAATRVLSSGNGRTRDSADTIVPEDGYLTFKEGDTGIMRLRDHAATTFNDEGLPDLPPGDLDSFDEGDPLAGLVVEEGVPATTLFKKKPAEDTGDPFNEVTETPWFEKAKEGATTNTAPTDARGEPLTTKDFEDEFFRASQETEEDEEETERTQLRGWFIPTIGIASVLAALFTMSGILALTMTVVMISNWNVGESEIRPTAQRVVRAELPIEGIMPKRTVTMPPQEPTVATTSQPTTIAMTQTGTMPQSDTATANSEPVKCTVEDLSAIIVHDSLTITVPNETALKTGTVYQLHGTFNRNDDGSCTWVNGSDNIALTKACFPSGANCPTFTTF